jgi:hypothetical protein
MKAIQKVSPKGSAANAPTSTLAKLLSWNLENPFLSSERLVHQADYMIHFLTSITDKDDKKVRPRVRGRDILTLRYKRERVNT